MSTHVPVVEQITKANDRIAAANRQALDHAGAFSMNIMASPGAGKTSLIESTLGQVADTLRIGVVEGDLSTSLDAERAAQAGARSVQINAAACHLDASMVSQAFDELPLVDLDVVIVENVGNLICPASFDLGTHVNVLIASVPEGDDKPFKYPKMYRGVQVLVINKIDLLPYVKFDMQRFTAGVEALNEGVLTFPLSCSTGAGVDAWVHWIEQQRRRHSVTDARPATESIGPG